MFLIIVAMFAAFLILLILLVSPARTREVSHRERVMVQRVAERAFPGMRCSRLHIVWVHVFDDAHIPAADTQARELIAAGYVIDGYAYGGLDGSCDIGVRSDLPPAKACTVAVHERGHLVGLLHGNGVRVMGDALGRIGAYVWPDCLRR